MNHVDLCSGIGGFALGFQWAGLSKPVMFCDVEPWCRKVLAKHWPDVPIEEDVKVLANEPERIPDCTILTAGYPCQPFSQAGKRRGAEDDRHIWPYINEIVAQKRPAWCVFENVYGHISMGLDEVLLDLEGQGYATRPFIVPACGVDAPHKRDRIWIIARLVEDATSSKRAARAKESRAFSEGNADGRESDHFSGSGENVADASRIVSDGGKSDAQVSGESGSIPKFRGGCGKDDVADAQSEGLERQWRGDKFVSARDARQTACDCGEEIRARKAWLPEPAVGRVANGIPRRVDRLRGLGNAIVPQIAMQIGLTIKEVQG